MRVIVAHNRYRSALPSGENTMVDAEIAGLEARGVVVDRLLADSDDIGGFSMAARVGLVGRPTWSWATRRRFHDLVAHARPDVVHLHNPYPLLSPGVVRWAKAAGVPVVQTVHNVRHACLPGTFARDGRECRDCEGRRVPVPAVRHGCYRGSRPESAVQAVAHVAHHGTWRLVDRYLAVSQYVADVVAGTGIDPDRIEVRPHGVADPGPADPPGDVVLYVGRLSEDKGVGLLLDAWTRGGLPRLVIAGDGDLRPRVEATALANRGVEYLGRLTRDEVGRQMRTAAAIVVPSVVPEALPTVVLEAFAHGRPVVATTAGALPDLVDPSVGALVPLPATAGALVSAVGQVVADAPARGAAARARYEQRFTADRSLDRLVAVYRELASG